MREDGENNLGCCISAMIIQDQRNGLNLALRISIHRLMALTFVAGSVYTGSISPENCCIPTLKADRLPPILSAVRCSPYIFLIEHNGDIFRSSKQC